MLRTRHAVAAATVLLAAAAPAAATASQSFPSRPDLTPPSVRVTTKPSAVAPGSLFVAPKGGDEQRGPMIYDDTGQLVYFQPVKTGQTVLDFRAQTYRGEPVLTWWQGVAKRGYGEGHGVVYDARYHPIATVEAAGGRKMDFHEFTITPQNTALIDTYRIVRQDLRSVKGGKKNDLAMENTVQEVDIATGELLWEWVANDDIAPTESYDVVPRRAAFPYDYLHLNSVNLDTDGNVVVSSRAAHALYKLERGTGRLLWRLGGKKSDFAMGPGTRTAWQHDAEPQGDGTFTVFDNNADEPAPGKETRGVQLKVDESARTVSLLRQWTNPKSQLSPSQGNLQALPGGDVLMGWGGTATNLTEFSATGAVQFEASFTNRNVETYRAYRLPWTAQPTSPPKAAARRSGRSTAVRVSWNGATTVASWRVLGGSTASRLTPRRTVARNGFETLLRYPGNDSIVAVQALDGNGAVLSTSRSARVGQRW
ncbi:arylsulfotransferase family protein [Patulibacter sp. NPDC049589]|uniref:arylsulfotransferase family protein n=1 Tax=Patulibacter sp. NPDC049589 TaxID=3154731 RepID=UPI003439A4DA